VAIGRKFKPKDRPIPAILPCPESNLPNSPNSIRLARQLWRCEQSPDRPDNIRAVFNGCFFAESWRKVSSLRALELFLIAPHGCNP
jgi:hypothetical protein